MTERGVYSPDGQRLAYLPLEPAFNAWKRYRGGTTAKIWLADLASSKVEEIPHPNSNDVYPMWIGDRVWFLSDRSGPVTLYSYDTKTRKVAQAIENKGLDYKWASAGPDVIALEHFGAIELYDWKSGKVTPVPVRVAGDVPGVRPSIERLSRYIQSAGISPTGVRAVFQARGEILTVPADKGDIRNLTNTSGAADRFPAWSPDGKSIAYFSDESGEYELHVRPQNGFGEPRKYGLGQKGFFYSPLWSPDSKKIAFRTFESGIAILDVESGKVTGVDRDFYNMPYREETDYAWSPDSKWLAYAKLLKNVQRAIYVYSVAEAKSQPLSDGLSDAFSPQFDAGGKHLYFLASTNQALGKGWLDMSSLQGNSTSNAYLVVLRKDDSSPLAPESDEEKTEAEKKPEAPKPAEGAKQADPAKPGQKPEPVEVRIDWEGISQRILALPVPSRPFRLLRTGKTGIVFLLENPPQFSQQPGGTLHKFDLKPRKLDTFLQNVAALEIAHNGEKMLFSQGGGGGQQGQSTPMRWFIGGTAAAPRPARVRCAPNKWKPASIRWLNGSKSIARRSACNAISSTTPTPMASTSRTEKASTANILLASPTGRTSTISSPRSSANSPSATCMCSAEPAGDPHRAGRAAWLRLQVENGRYRFERIFDGENWNPTLRAPLTQPGVNVKAGEYLLAVNGREVRASDDVYSFFEATANRSVTLKVGPNADGSGAREVAVVPVPNERQLRYMAWVEGNRRKVAELSNGRLGYLHLPNTAEAGYTNFNRWYFAQTDKEGIVLDERFNGADLLRTTSWITCAVPCSTTLPHAMRRRSPRP